MEIVTDPAGYMLRAPAEVVNARLAERLVAEGREAAARLLREALALWRGRALAEFADQPFAQAEAARLEELREAAREDLAEVELALGRHHDLVGELEVIVASHPLRERRWAQLLLAHQPPRTPTHIIAGRICSTSSRPPRRAAGGRPPARQRHHSHRGAGLTQQSP